MELKSLITGVMTGSLLTYLLMAKPVEAVAPEEVEWVAVCGNGTAPEFYFVPQEAEQGGCGCQRTTR